MITDLHCRGTTGEILRRWVTGEIGAASLDLHFRHWVYGRDWENNKGKNEEERQKNKRGEAEKDESQRKKKKREREKSYDIGLVYGS